MTEPLTALESALFAEAIQEHWEAEVSPREEVGLPRGED